MKQRDYVVEKHPWETKPNPQFDYPEDEALRSAVEKVRAVELARAVEQTRVFQSPSFALQITSAT